MISLYAGHKKLFQSYASSLEGIAIVQSHSSEKLKVKLISIEQKKKHEPDREIGEEYEILPFYCSLIPPKGWIID